MRNLIIKFYFGIYRFNAFGKKNLTIERSAVMNFITMIIMAITLFAIQDPTFRTWVLMSLFALLVFCTFVYFRLVPVKWDELDEIQKWYYGCYYVYFVQDRWPWPGDFISNLKEWEKLDKKYK